MTPKERSARLLEFLDQDGVALALPMDPRNAAGWRNWEVGAAMGVEEAQNPAVAGNRIRKSMVVVEELVG